MENYKVQLKIAREDVPSRMEHFDEAHVWEKIKEIVCKRKASVTVLERDEDYSGFDFPAEVTKINADWDPGFKGALYIESDLLLEEAEANEASVIRKFHDLLQKSNLELYSYYHGGDLYQSHGYIDDEFSLSGPEEQGSMQEPSAKEREQLDLFKKKKK